MAKSIAPKLLPARSAASTRLTLSKNSAQSNVDIVRMLVITLRTVTFIAAWRWCSWRTSSSGDVPRPASCSLEPASAGVDVGILLAQALDELHREGHRQGSGLEPPKGETARRFPAEPEQLVRERVGVAARSATVDDLLGQAPEVLQEHQRSAIGTAHSSPMVSGWTRWNALDEALESLGLEAAVGMGDEGPGQPEYPRVALEGSLGELRQLAVESRRQILPDLSKDVLHDVEVVDEPLRGRGDRAFLSDHRGELAIASQQHAPAVPHAR